MKVALIGNMNNNFFVLQRFLQDEGIDCSLFILPYEPVHFSPQNDTWDTNNLESVTKLTWGELKDFSFESKKLVRESIGSFDKIIACGTSPAFLAICNIKINLFIPYGSDLYELPFSLPRNPFKIAKRLILNYYQKKGIRNANYCSIADTSDSLVAALTKIKFEGSLISAGVPMVYPLKTDVTITSKYLDEFKQVKNKHELIIFHHSRHVWNDISDPVAVKRNDKLLVAIAECIKNSNLDIALITLEYGGDVVHSKKLITELDIENNVYWFPKMPRKELMLGIEYCDLVAGEFNNSWFTYGVVFEAMAMAKPIMHYRDDSLYPNFEMYPMINALTIPEIKESLVAAYKDKDTLLKIGSEGKEWYYNYFVKDSLRQIISALNQ